MFHTRGSREKDPRFLDSKTAPARTLHWHPQGKTHSYSAVFSPSNVPYPQVSCRLARLVSLWSTGWPEHGCFKKEQLVSCTRCHPLFLTCASQDVHREQCTRMNLNRVLATTVGMYGLLCYEKPWIHQVSELLLSSQEPG